MRWKMLIGILIPLLVVGCATPYKKQREIQHQQNQQLQQKVVLLERELSRRDQELNYLRNEVKEKERESQKVTSPTVRQVQSALKIAGFYKGTVDGKMGPRTKEAIFSFQKANGLTADGIVGRKTWSKLANYAQ